MVVFRGGLVKLRVAAAGQIDDRFEARFAPPVG